MGPYILPSDDVLAYICHFTLLLIYILAAYTRFGTLLTDDMGKKELYGMRELSLLSSALVVGVLVFGVLMVVFPADDWLIDTFGLSEEGYVEHRPGNGHLHGANIPFPDDGVELTSKQNY